MIVLIFLYDLLEEVYFVSLGIVGYDIYLHFVTLPNMFLHDTLYSADQGPLPLCSGKNIPMHCEWLGVAPTGESLGTKV